MLIIYYCSTFLTLILPKKYLSYSAIDLWVKNKNGYRKRYYENEPFIETPESAYGKIIHKMIETGDPLVAKIPTYNLSEHKIEVMIGEVPMIGYIDSLCDHTARFYDYKTGRPKPDGSPRWDAVEVARTDQLPFYSLFLKEVCGHVEDLCHLIWLPTSFKKKTAEFAGHTLEATTRDIEWNGEVHVFPRIIREYERKAAKEKIIRVANEIAKDYEAYKKSKEGILSRTSAQILG
jgi:hypothetical protein